MSNARYTIFAARAVFDPDLTLADKVVLAALGSYTNGDGWCFPSQKTLVERLGIARSTLCAALKKLSDNGYIAVRPRTAKGRGKVGNEYRVLTDLPPMSDQKDIGKVPMSEQSDNGHQHIEYAPMSGVSDNGADVRFERNPMSDQPDIAYKDGTTPSERAHKSSPVSKETEEDVGRRQAEAYEALERAKAEIEAKAKANKARAPAKAKPTRKRTPYSAEFEAIWLSWPKNRRMNSDKRKAFERYETGVEQFGAPAIASAAKRYLSLPDTRKDQWRYCCLVEVFMNGKLEAAVEAALEADSPTATGETVTHEDAEHHAARRYYEQRGKWPAGYKPPTETRLA